MNKYIVKRILSSFLILFGVSILIFSLVNLQPGNPYLNKIGPNTSQEQIEEILREKGYYDPLYIKYVKWAKDAVKLDFGYSLEYGLPVSEVIGERLPNTLLLSIPALLISIVISIPIGIYCAYREGGFVDRLVNLFSLVGVSIPTFFFAILLIKVFAFDLKWFPISGMTSLSGKDSILKHMTLPLIVLTFLNMSTLVRYIRTSMVEELKKDYIKTARGKGLTMVQAIKNHGLKNIMTSIITIVAMQIPGLFSGALVTESIFVWPGIGKLNYDAALYRDYPLIMGLLILSVVVILLSNLLADILYVLVDRRISYE